MEHTPNISIQCSVEECKYHCKDEQYCSLDQIMVGCHEEKANTMQCTDCQSFEPEHQSNQRNYW